MTQLICLIALNIEFGKKLNAAINLSTPEHDFTESCERCIYILL